MAIIKIIDPVTRVEGHLKVKIEIDLGEIIDASVSGTLYRGFENILKDRVPEDVPIITQRICGVCPISHAQASVMALENVSNWKPNVNGTLLRNLILGSNFIQSHILHFYVLTATDFVAGPSKPPWLPSWNVDIRPGAEAIMDHFTDAIEARLKAHDMCAIFGGKLPHAASYIPGGITADVTTQKKNNFMNLLNPLIDFIENIYIPDVELLGSVYSDYYNIGAGPENLLSFGCFEGSDGNNLFNAGYIEKGDTSSSTNFDSNDIIEYVTSSWYNEAPGLPPASGETNPQFPKSDAYSWIKSPRLFDNPFESGPLARMKINGDYTGGVSVIDRNLARAQEALKIANAMIQWLNELGNGSGYDTDFVQDAGMGEGLSEAPRGSLGHWVNIGSNGKIEHYQIVTPTCWNASPKDSNDVKGPMEQALIGTPIQNEEQPIEALRVVHSFDPCLACAVHVLDASGKEKKVINQ